MLLYTSIFIQWFLYTLYSIIITKMEFKFSFKFNVTYRERVHNTRWSKSYMVRALKKTFSVEWWIDVDVWYIDAYRCILYLSLISPYVPNENNIQKYFDFMSCAIVYGVLWDILDRDHLDSALRLNGFLLLHYNYLPTTTWTINVLSY